MPFDIVAFYETQTATTLREIASVIDDVYKSGSATSDELIVKKRASFLGGVLFSCVSGGGAGTFRYGELRQPSLKVPFRTQTHIGLHGTKPEGGMVNLFASPLPLYAEEKLTALVQNSAAEVSQCLLWLISGRCTRAMQEAVNPTHMITGYCDQTLTAGAWTKGTMVWDHDLPKGRYAVVGMDGGSYVTGGGNYPFTTARLLLLDSTWRPGSVLREMWADKIAMDSPTINAFDAFQRWPLMREISFAHDQMPDAEFLSGHARTDHVLNLLLQKIQ